MDGVARLPKVPKGAALFECCVHALVKQYLWLSNKNDTKGALMIPQALRNLPEEVKAHVFKAFNRMALLDDATLPFFALAYLTKKVNLARQRHLSEEALFKAASLWQCGVTKLNFDHIGIASDRMVEMLCHSPVAESLEVLNLGFNVSISDNCVQHLAKCTKLSSLHLSRCGRVTNDVVPLLIEHCPSLEKLALFALDNNDRTFISPLIPSSPTTESQDNNSPNSNTKEEKRIPLPKLRKLDVWSTSVRTKSLWRMLESRIGIAPHFTRVGYLREASFGNSPMKAVLAKMMRDACPNADYPPSYLCASDIPYLLCKRDCPMTIDPDDDEIFEFQLDESVSFSSLTSLQMNCCRTTKSEPVRLFFTKTPNLRSMTLRDPPAMHEYGLHDLSSLESLFVSRGQCDRLYPDSLITSIPTNQRAPCFDNLKVVSFYGSKIPVGLLQQIGRLHRLRTLDLESIRFVGDTTLIDWGLLWKDLIGSLSELRKLELCDIAWQHPFSVAIEHDKLKYLRLVEKEGKYTKAKPPFHMTVPSIRCPKLKVLEVKLDAMDPAAQSELLDRVRYDSPWVTTVEGSVLTKSLTFTSRRVPESLHSNVWSAPLTKVIFHKCALEREGVERLLSSLWRLHTLKFQKCTGMSSLNGCVCPSLQVLRVKKDNGLIGDMNLRAGFPNLLKITLQLGPNVTSVSLGDMPVLAICKLKRKGELANLKELNLIGLPMLRVLRIDWYPHISDLRLEGMDRLQEGRLFFSCDSLIFGSASMEDGLELEARAWTNVKEDLRRIIAIGCPKLQNLYISRLQGLDREFLQEVADINGSQSALASIVYKEAKTSELLNTHDYFYVDDEEAVEVIHTHLLKEREKEKEQEEEKEKEEESDDDSDDDY